jgi:hypothetical protein
VGNAGLQLFREDCDALLTRRALVLDDDDIPITHSLLEYYSEARVRELVGALAFLRDPRSPAGRLSTLAALDPATGRLPHAAATRQLYQTWRARPGATSLGRVRIRRPE